MASRLKGSSSVVIADKYDEASVLFADLAGFTARASDTAPVDLIAFLNEVFTAFDRLVESHGLEDKRLVMLAARYSEPAPGRDINRRGNDPLPESGDLQGLRVLLLNWDIAHSPSAAATLAT